MRHHDANRKLGRKRNQRKALINSLARSLVLHDKVKTTEAKAKELRPFVEKLVTHGKKDTLATRRLLEKYLGPKASKKVLVDISPTHKDRQGGYTRITKLMPRKSDASPMAVIEFVSAKGTGGSAGSDGGK